jgi:hypothetical protein
MTKFFAHKTPCQQGHTHASAKEAKRCGELHTLERAGKIAGLQVEPTYTFVIEGKPLTHANGRKATYKPDFTYVENGKLVAEDVKAKNGFASRDVPLRTALFRHLNPSVELRFV